MELSPDLLDLLVCPESRQPLVYVPSAAGEESFLFCEASRLKYRIEDGVPVLLVDEAVRLGEAEAAHALARARRATQESRGQGA